MVSGGRNRSTLPNVPAVRVNTPLSWQCRVTAATASRLGSRVPGTTSSAAIIAPRPRISPITSVRRGDVAQLAHHQLTDGLRARASS